MHAGVLDHPDVGHRTPDVGDQLPEFVDQICAVLGHPLVAHELVGLLRAVIRIVGVILGLTVPEPPEVRQQPGLDDAISQEVVEEVQFGAEELDVDDVHCGVDHAGAVELDGVGDVLDGDHVQLLGVQGCLDEELVMQVVVVLHHEHMNVPHDRHHIHPPVLQGLPRQLAVHHRQPVLVLRQCPHLLVGPAVVEGNGCEVVEGLRQVGLDGLLDINDLPGGESDGPHSGDDGQVAHRLGDGVVTLVPLQHDGPHMQAQIRFDGPSQGANELLLQNGAQLPLVALRQCLGLAEVHLGLEPCQRGRKSIH
mmetsp:Transcript_46552/g.122948  ORF Transcript_46552/g.122948 Transcript_46552/m.122948 type:complete len:308 (+) Transcript_46552:740-1663(+)